MDAMRIFFLVSLGSSLWLALPVLAQKNSFCAHQPYRTVDSAKVALQEITQVEVVAPRLRHVIASGKLLQHLGREELELFGLDDLAEAISTFAGAEVKDYGGIGGMKTVSVRNLGAHHTAVSYDGIIIGNTQAGQIDIGRYGMDNVQSLSLAVGDNDEMMQSARQRASASVLYIETMRPVFTEGRNCSLWAKLKTGSFGQLNSSLSYGQQLGRGSALRVFGEFLRADGSYPFTLENGSEHTREKRQNSDVNAWRGEANLYHDLPGGEVVLKAYAYRSERGLPGSVVLYNNVAHERLWDEDVFLHASFKKQLGKLWQLGVRAKYTHSWNKYRDEDVKYTGGELVEVNRQNECYLSSTIGWNPCKIISVALAQDVVYADLRSNGENPAQPKRWTSLTSLDGKFSWGRLEFSAGCVATYTKEEVEHGEAPADRKRLSPCLSLLFRPFSKDAFYIRTMMKHTFRVPTFNDLYYDRVGTVTLQPEKAREYNLGMAWQGATAGNMKYLSASMDVYYNDVTDKIVAFPTLYVWKMANYGKVKMWGINATLSSEVQLSRGFTATMLASYSLQVCRDFTDKTASYYKQQLPYTPKHVGHGMVAANTQWFRISYNLSACGERYCLQDHKPNYRIKPYWEHDMTLSRDWRCGKCKIVSTVSISNLTNEQYEVVKYYPMPGRSWTLAVTVEL